MVQFIKQRIFNFASKCFGNTPNNSSVFFEKQLMHFTTGKVKMQFTYNSCN